MLVFQKILRKYKMSDVTWSLKRKKQIIFLSVFKAAINDTRRWLMAGGSRIIFIANFGQFHSSIH